MVEHRRFGNWLPHLVLLAGVIVVAFPVYLAIIASTHDNSVIANGQMPLYPGSHALDTYWNTIVSGTGKTTRQPVGGMMIASLVMAVGIAVGKIRTSTGSISVMKMVQNAVIRNGNAKNTIA